MKFALFIEIMNLFNAGLHHKMSFSSFTFFSKLIYSIETLFRFRLAFIYT